MTCKEKLINDIEREGLADYISSLSPLFHLPSCRTMQCRQTEGSSPSLSPFPISLCYGL